MPPPVICTLLLDEESQARFDRLREAHFPPERNHLAAHVTLFHALPGSRSEQVVSDVRTATRRQPFAVAVTGVRFLGRGVAYELQSPELSALRAGLAARWDPWLGPQDRSRFRPHVTVQNKVAPAVGRALHERLSSEFTPGAVSAVGLALWHYRGGPWEPLVRVPFRPNLCLTRTQCR